MKEDSHLVDAFEAEAADLGLSQPEARSLFMSLPLRVRGSPTFRWIVGSGWHYMFGAPLHLDAGEMAMGTPQIQPVSRLVQAMVIASNHLTHTELVPFLSRLDDPARHADAVVEMAAVYRCEPSTRMRYEPEGLGYRDARIDWLLVAPFQRQFLLEIKNRIGHLAREAIRIQPGIHSGATTIPGEPRLDLDGLFKSTWEKFLPVQITDRIQGILVFVPVKVPETAFRAFFRDRLSKRVHFAALTSDGRSWFILASSSQVLSDTSRLFRFSFTRDTVY
jgi:hypothetical protein